MDKNIGIDARLWYESGVGRYIRNLIKGFDNSKNKFNFTVFLNSKAYNQVDFKNPKIKKIKTDVKWHTLKEQYLFKKIIEKENLDLMHFTYFSYPVFYKKPFVITIHDLIIDNFPTGKASSLPFPIYNLKHFGYKQITKQAVKNSKKIIVPSQATKKDLVSLYSANPQKIEVVHEGFDTLINKSEIKNLDNTGKYILYVGNAYPHKNLKNLILAFKKIRKKHDIDLICVGRNDFFYERLEDRISPNIKYLHNVDDSELFGYYTNAICLVVPSLVEGFGLPLLEAMNLSCPVVASDIESLKEVGKDAVIYFNPNDVLDIESKIEKVLTDEKLRKNLIEKGKVRSHDFDWKDTVDKTLKIYESSIGLRQSE